MQSLYNVEILRALRFKKLVNIFEPPQEDRTLEHYNLSKDKFVCSYYEYEYYKFGDESDYHNKWIIFVYIIFSLNILGVNINSLAPGKFEWKFRYVIFKWILVIDGWSISCEIALIWMPLGLHWWSVNIGSGNGLVTSGNKPLPEPMLTQIFVAIWCH